MNIFNRYAPFIRDFIYQNNWESLRAIQVAAGDAVFNTDDNLLLSASTASGKTEAAFFPILTLFTEDMPKSVGAVYIGPLKALINDQFQRLNDLCREADIPVWHWHGDVAQSRKKRLLENPSGILQITPESLEALLLHKHAYIARLFGDLRFIVIDEVHSLMRGDRGGQTLCLIERLSKLAGVNPRGSGSPPPSATSKATGEISLRRNRAKDPPIPKIEAGGAPLAALPWSTSTFSARRRRRSGRSRTRSRSWTERPIPLPSTPIPPWVIFSSIPAEKSALSS